MTIYLLTNGINRIAGTERVIVQLSKIFDNVIVIVPGTTAVAFSGYESIKIVSVQIGDFPESDILKKIAHRVNYLNKLKAILDSNSTVISFAFDLNIINIILSQAIGFRPIICEHIEYNYHKGIRNIIRKKFYTKKNVTLVCLTDTDRMKFNHDKINAVTIPNFIHPVKNNYFMDSKEILSIGRLEYQKNFSFLIDSFFQSKLYEDGWRLTIVGEGTEEKLLKDKIDSLEMNTFISINKFTKDVNKYYEKAALLCMTSRFEAFPMVLLEALNHGLPVLVSDFPTGAQEILGKGNHQIVRDYDVVTYSKNLSVICNDSEARTQFSFENLQLIQKYFPERIVESWHRLVQNEKTM